MEDAEREGGSCVENGCVSADDVGADGDRGVGSLTPLDMGGARGGESAGGGGAVSGADNGAGAGALVVRVGRATDDAAAMVAPVSRETSLREMGFPEKNSPAERQGSMDGAGGKMSDWNDSDWRAGRRKCVTWAV